MSGNSGRKKRLTLKWLPVLPYLRAKSLKHNSGWKYEVCSIFSKLTSTEAFWQKVCASSNKEIGPCLFSVTRSSGGMIHICIVSTVNWFQLKIKWEISLLLPKRKSEKKMCKSPKRRLLNVNTNTSVVKTIPKYVFELKKKKWWDFIMFREINPVD